MRAPLSLQQELTRKRRAVQLAQRQDALGHAFTLQKGARTAVGSWYEPSGLRRIDE
jgi:hypothetical protein